MNEYRTNAAQRKGFTLVELMIVVSIIAILMAIAIPIISNARMRTNEGSAVSSIRTITSANTTYRTRFGSYADSLGDLSSAGIIDSVLGSADALPGKSGYLFSYNVAGGFWDLQAAPIDPGASGQRHFYADVSGIIRFADGVPAGSSSKPID